MVDVKSKLGITGLDAQKIFETVNITCNKNSIPGDTEKPAYCSGIRLGTPAMTTRGFKEKEFIKVGNSIDQALINKNNPEKLKVDVSFIFSQSVLTFIIFSSFLPG